MSVPAREVEFIIFGLCYLPELGKPADRDEAQVQTRSLAFDTLLCAARAQHIAERMRLLRKHVRGL